MDDLLLNSRITKDEVDMLKDDLSTFNGSSMGINNNDTEMSSQPLPPIPITIKSAEKKRHEKREFPIFTLIKNHLEIFIKICSHLEPLELASLRLTCKDFNDLLKSPIDSITQQIWKQSRVKFCEFYQLPPPLGVSEQTYVGMIYSENGCQVCGDLSKSATIYWNPLVICCTSCFNKNTISENTIRYEWDFPESIIKILIPITLKDLFGDYLRYYWIASVGQQIDEFINLEPTEEKPWLKSKVIQYHFAISTSLEREYWERCRYIKKYRLTTTETKKRKSIKGKEVERLHQNNQNQQVEASIYPTYFGWLAQLDILPIFENEYKNALKAASAYYESDIRIIKQEVDKSNKYGAENFITCVGVDQLDDCISPTDTILGDSDPEDTAVSPRHTKKARYNPLEERTNSPQHTPPRIKNVGYSLRARTPTKSPSSSLNGNL
ncbi:920_t:CDS:2 [Ambispora leptoticha]|uniref:920_t:CDS:1 n=1 Tax=Ambispora leptoticha TaxID=144679 RepID=A0A9N9BHZ8_9GLOM|nr:920_t:CDS:2 [Ambispora leptoticha]